MDSSETEGRRKRHPIQVVSRRTGLSPDVLRAWEKRYGVVEPGRSEGGRRLYSDNDIDRLRLLRRASDAGRRISQIAQLSDEDLAVMVEEDEREQVETGASPGEGAAMAAEGYLRAALEAVGGLDNRTLETVLNRAVVTLSAATLIQKVAAPLMRRIGDMWEHGDLEPAHEHLASAVVLRVMGRMIELAERSATDSTLVVSTPANELHEFGALFAAATAATEGWRVTYLGPDLPAEDIALAARNVNARAVALSIVTPKNGGGLEEELRKLRRELPPAVPLFIGGEGAGSFADVIEEIKAVRMSDLEKFSLALAGLA